MTIWVYRTSDGQPHWSSTQWIAFSLGNYQITQIRTEQDASRMRDVFSMTTDEWCNMRVRAGLPMYPSKPDRPIDPFRLAVDEFSVAAVRAVTPAKSRF